MKCKQCGLILDVLPEGKGEYLCPNCGFCLRKGESADADKEKASPTDTTSATHLKIAKTVNVGFGDFASVLAATDASKIVATDTSRDLERTRTATASTLNVEAPDDEDEVLSQLDVYDEDDEYARIQADIAARQKTLDARAAELDAREKHLNKKLDELIAEKEFLRTGIEKSDLERAAYLKQKDALDAQRAAMEKEMAARMAALDARAAEIDRKSVSLGKARTSLEELKRELDATMSGEQPAGDGVSSSSVSIPYSAKLLRRNSSLERTVRILKRVLICLGILLAVLIALLLNLMAKNNARDGKPEAKDAETDSTLMRNADRTETTPSPSSPVPAEPDKSPAPEQSSGGGL